MSPYGAKNAKWLYMSVRDRYWEASVRALVPMPFVSFCITGPPHTPRLEYKEVLHSILPPAAIEGIRRGENIAEYCEYRSN